MSLCTRHYHNKVIVFCRAKHQAHRACIILNMLKLKARPSLIPSLCTHYTRAGIEWRR